MTKPVFALLVGCEYHKTKNYLPGCIYDVKTMREHFENSIPKENIAVMTDDEGLYPSKDNIISELKKLVEKGSKTPSTLIFHFSGHGASVLDMNFDEEDGSDECLIPLGKINSINDVILDDELHEIVSELSSKSKLFILTDCCHSGTCFDLKYAYRQEKDIPENWLSVPICTKPNIVKLSGCRDEQTSASIKLNYTWKGALTLAFLSSIAKSKSWKELFVHINTHLSNMGLDQRPVLSTNLHGNPGNIFI